MGNTSSQTKDEDEKTHNGLDKIEAHLTPNSFETSDETVSDKENDSSQGKKSSSRNSRSKGKGRSAGMVVSHIPPDTMTESGPASPGKDRTSNTPGSKKNGLLNIDTRDDVLPRSTIIKDEQVLVNLAMADLMAYLQVVANNSNNLPLTKRDDPELTRMVTNLTSEEYARKSAAFIPADVRVIAGSFLKYGNVWDLPTSEEYMASDGAQEPGEF